MLVFEKIIIINGYRYDIETDPNTLVLDLFKRITHIDNHIVMILNYGSEKHFINLSKLITHHLEIAKGTIVELISNLTTELIYSFTSTVFNKNKTIRTFMSHDLPGSVTISPYNIITDERVNTIYDPAYRDIIITCDKYNLLNSIPIIGNKLKSCMWGNNNIYIKDQVEILKDVRELTFLSFYNVDIKLIALRSILNTQIDSNKSYILVLNGSLFFNTNHVFYINKSKQKLTLVDSFILCLFQSYDSIDAIIDNEDSFVIEIDSPHLFTRDIDITQIDNKNGSAVFKYFETPTQYNHIDYICLNRNDNTVCGMTVVDDLYEHVAIKTTRNEHHIYVHDGSTDMRLIQLVVG